MEEQNIEKTISSTFDSVNLINKIILETADDKKKSNVERNIQHLELMMTKETFTEALSSTQKNEIKACITAGKNYIK